MSSPERPGMHKGSRRTCRGAMLIDVLVGLSVGAIAVGAAIATLQVARETASAVNELSLLQQQSAHALRIFGQQLLPAGSRALEASSGKAGGFRLAAVPVEADAAAPSLIQGRDGGRKASDSLRIVRISSPLLASQQYDCLGEKISSGGRVEASFEVDAKGVLRCRNAAGRNQPLLNGVEALKLRYRVRQGEQLRDLTASEAEALQLWPSVVALELCLDLRGELRAAAYERRYADCSGQQASSAGRLHLVTRKLFQLRTPSGG